MRQNTKKLARIFTAPARNKFSLESETKKRFFRENTDGKYLWGKVRCTTISRLFIVRDGNLQGMWLLSLHKATEIIIIRNYIWALGQQLAEKEEKTKCRLELSKLFYVAHSLSH